MTVSPKIQGHLIMLLVMSIFGLNIPVAKYLYASGYISPFGMTACRMTFGAVAFWIVSLFMPKEKVERKDLFIFLAGGIMGMALNQGLFAYGLNHTSSVDASIITTSGPLFAMVIAAIVLREPITFRKVSGVLVGGAGAIVLILSGQQTGSQQNEGLIGDAAILCAQFFYAFYIVITRPASGKYSSITMMKWMFLVATIATLPLFGQDAMNANIFKQDEVIPYLCLFFVLLGATFFTYLLIPLAQRRIRPTTISMYNNLQPIIASSIAIIVMGDKFTIYKLFAAILVFVGVYLVTTSKSRKDVEEEEVKRKLQYEK